MKRFLMIALLISAIPAVAVGQTVMCDECTHVASVYMGEGGFIATADDADMVTWVASCGGVTRSGEEPANDDGVVSALWTGDLACMADGGGTFEIGPVMDGGWFWVTDETNSAVGGLVGKNVLDNDTAAITGAGDSVEMTMGKGAVYLKHGASGRVGILPNILPEPPPTPAAICGPRADSDGDYTRQATSSCMLGDGGSKIRLQGPGRYGGTAALAGGMVTRNNAGAASVEVLADLWVNETGSYSTADPATPAKGWIDKGEDNWLGVVGWHVTLAGAAPGASVTNAGVTFVDTGNNGQLNITIAPSTSYCPAKGDQTTAVINVIALGSGVDLDGPGPGTDTSTTGASTPDSIHPALAGQKSLGGAYAVTQLTIMCPPQSSSAHQGQELIPENPFPTDR